MNGVARSVLADRSLLTALRGELGLLGAKPGCGEGACASCTVLVDGDPIRACQVLTGDLAGRSVTTVEGLRRDGRLHPVQEAFVEVGAVQCGYCTPGMVLGAVALLARDPEPDDGAINSALSGNICRCGTYPRIRRAVHRAAELIAQSDPQQRSGSTPPRATWTSPAPDDPGPRPNRPWDLTPIEGRDWFAVLGAGLVVVLPPRTPAPGMWANDGGAWLHVGVDGVVTAFTGKVDVGQDNTTALSLLVAEELRVPLDHVRLVMGDTDLCPYDVGTFGSRSMPDAGRALSRLAAHTRPLLALADGASRVEVVTGEPVPTAPSAWRVAGRAHLPAATLDAVTGGRRFVSDLSGPDFWHGALLRPPVLGATLRRLDATAIERRSDVLLVHTPTVTGVVARDGASARAALAELEVDWELPELPSEEQLEGFLRAHPVAGGVGWSGPFHREEGEPELALANAPVRQRGTYSTAYLAAAPLETRAALAKWDAAGRLTIWTGTQTPFPVRAQVAAALDLDERDVRVIVPPTGGGFGGKHAAGVATEAATLARATGRPVRVAWSRHEEFTAGTLRPAAVIDVEVGATSDGTLRAWSFANINSGAAAITTPYRVQNERLDYQPSQSPLLQGSYRALAATANNFARECHLDELARHLGRDPLEFRLSNLADERLAAVLRAAAERFGWTTGRGHGHGIACGLEKEGRVATVAEVGVGEDGRIEIVRLVTAYECGAVVNPETVVNQIEGATVMALGGALFEAIHFHAGVITNGSFSEYRVPRITDIPPIDVVLLHRPDLAPAGAGETPMIAVAPAIANAIFDATGRRPRALPML